jgi:hypothetical protein
MFLLRAQEFTHETVLDWKKHSGVINNKGNQDRQLHRPGRLTGITDCNPTEREPMRPATDMIAKEVCATMSLLMTRPMRSGDRFPRQKRSGRNESLEKWVGYYKYLRSSYNLYWNRLYKSDPLLRGN